MVKDTTNPEVDWYFDETQKWQEEFRLLRTIVLACDLKEELKWGCACYTLDKSNVVLIHGFKEYCALLFFQGALLNDPDHILIQQTKNVQAGRQIRFTSVQEISKMDNILKAYIHAAIDIEKSGAKVTFKKTEDFAVPEEFQSRLSENPALQAAFEALTPGRQRAYLFHFSAPKQSKTRETRVEKFIPHILGGKGLDD
ncbi:YdeI/OmpD-associated family protein [Phyllobacterium sp. OV277]|uniref:YdeI/OmpD-associated family protein n=1 Tax=Phyllobacterium sp. OV277 TaxID=1882772 RepID=UPI0008888C5C|nr:YdeI/OmpD-associated family protein [Phyllobacterium sp. OV277]SDO40172.1 Uncharacterized conserved protein YdeI, YjbR/CyaY-like superfamily, DUF1801 family [Phyllobacterium sp. OV277]